MTPSERIAEYFADFPPHHYTKGEVILQADAVEPPVVYLERGTAGTIAFTESGSRLVINTFKPGTFFPMSVALNQTGNAYFYEALTETRVRLAPSAGFVEWFEQQPDIVLDLLKRVYRGTDGLLVRTVHLMTNKARSRVLWELTVLARRFGEVQPDGRYAILGTENALAEQTGLARETVSRELSKLKQEGLVGHSRGRLLISPELLKD